MDINVFAADELETVFRVLRTALKPAGELGLSETRLLETYSKITS